jgi:hypothetical protein
MILAVPCVMTSLNQVYNFTFFTLITLGMTVGILHVCAISADYEKVLFCGGHFDLRVSDNICSTSNYLVDPENKGIAFGILQ